jgi:hypothetical protein
LQTFVLPPPNPSAQRPCSFLHSPAIEGSRSGFGTILKEKKPNLEKIPTASLIRYQDASTAAPLCSTLFLHSQLPPHFSFSKMKTPVYAFYALKKGSTKNYEPIRKGRASPNACTYRFCASSPSASAADPFNQLNGAYNLRNRALLRERRGVRGPYNIEKRNITGSEVF